MNNHPLLEAPIGLYGKLILSPSQHILHIFVVYKDAEIALLLAFLEQPSGVIEEDD